MRVQVAAICTILASITPIVYAINTQTRYRHVFWDDDNWIITTDKLQAGIYQSRMSLANGYLGINVAAVGPFFEVDLPLKNQPVKNGWPLFGQRQTFATIAGFYDEQGTTSQTNYPWLDQYGGESVISGVPHWSGLVVEAHGAILNASVNPAHIIDFSSTLDVAAGLLGWRFSWTPGGSHEPIHLHYTMFVHKLHVNQAAVELKLTASRDTNVTVYDVLDGDCALRTEFVEKKFEKDSPTIWTAVRPSNVPKAAAYIYSTLRGNECVDWDSRTEATAVIFSDNVSSISQSVDLRLVAGETGAISKYIGAASSDAFSDPRTTARVASISGAEKGFVKLLHTHILEWEHILPRHSVDRYTFPNGSLGKDCNVQELHIAAVSTPFHILQNTVGPNAIAAAGNNTHLNIHSIPVCGLGSDCYGGLIFWDAEVWIAPGLQLSHPDHVQQVINYRVDKFPQAQENMNMAYSSSQNRTGQFSPGGAVYPWTSGRHGNCTGTGPCFDYEYHLMGDIGISFINHLVVTGDEGYFKETLLPIYNAIAYFYGEVLTYNSTSDTYSLLNATDPDEYANNVNNAAFTTALIQKHLNSTNMLNAWAGLPHNDSWAEMVSKMRLPTHEEAGIILEYNGMQGDISVKQADIVLIDDLLHYDNPYSLANLDYYAAKQSPNGPGMTYGAFSIVANGISPSGCSSYTYNLYSTQPYVRNPWFQFSEQLNDDFTSNGGTNPAFPFLTGMGGANRVAIFGYLGLRLLTDRLHINPSLPPQIPNIDYRTFYWQGYGINATSNSTHTTLARLPAENFTLPTANKLYKNAPIPVSFGTREGLYSLPVSPTEMLVFANRPGSQATTTTEGNILQCVANVNTTGEFLPGQFPLSAIDGATSTRWQPVFDTDRVYMTVDLGVDTPYYPIKEIFFDWAHSPPTTYAVHFSNVSVPPYEEWEIEKWENVTNVTHGVTEISRPYDPARLPIVERYIGNQTNITLETSIWSGRYVALGIKSAWKDAKGVGSFGEDEGELGLQGGATVAEWSLVRDMGNGKLVLHNATTVVPGGQERENPFSVGHEKIFNATRAKLQSEMGYNVRDNSRLFVYPEKYLARLDQAIKKEAWYAAGYDKIYDETRRIKDDNSRVGTPVRNDNYTGVLHNATTVVPGGQYRKNPYSVGHEKIFNKTRAKLQSEMGYNVKDNSRIQFEMEHEIGD